MYEMEHGLRSGEVFIKKKSSSGCLIIKKKIGSSDGVGPVPRKVLLSNKGIERRNLGISISGSSEDSIEPIRRGCLPMGDRFYDRSVMYGDGILGNNRFGRDGDFEGERRRKFDENDGMYKKRMRIGDLQEGYPIRHNLDINSTNNPYFGDEARLPVLPLRQKFRVHSDKIIRVQGKNGVLKVMVNKSKNVDLLRRYFDFQMEDVERFDTRANLSVGPSLYSGLKHHENANSSVRIEKSELEMQILLSKRAKAGDWKTKESDLLLNPESTSMVNIKKNMHTGPKSYDLLLNPESKSTVGHSLYSGPKHYQNANSSVRIEKSEPDMQNSLSNKAKAGDLITKESDLLLKPELTSVINRKNNMHTIHKSYDQQDLVRRGSNLETVINENAHVPVFYSDCKNGNLSSLKSEKSEIKLQNSLSKRVKSGDSETDNSNSSLKGEQISESSKQLKSEEKTPSTEKVTVVKGKETKVKRGTGTEKQLLREKIRHKLVNAGWKIDYRPRKNRDYLDAVYINPAGTAYWSIIKAYEAFKKHMGEEDVPEELLNKLTRQTRKKMEKEKMMKQREEAKSKNVTDFARGEEGTGKDDNDDKFSFLQELNGKSLKRKAEKSMAETSSHMMMKQREEVRSKNAKAREEEAEEDTENDDNDEKLSFLPKPNGKSLKRKAETNSHIIRGRKTQQTGISTLLARSFDKGLKARNDGYVRYMGKRTVLSWLVDSGTVDESEKVQYMNHKRTKIMIKGYITKDGIYCSCCNKVVTVSKFEIHAGSKSHEPFQNIFLESGVSLLQCQMEAWNQQDEAKRSGFYNLEIDGDDGNDDACGVCGDGGDMICCDGCPSTFHQSCIGIQTLPSGDWHCPNCTCKFCEKSSSRENALLTCNMCERKYHKSCEEEVDALSVDYDRKSNSFCGKKCQELFNRLQKLLEVKHKLEAAFSWSLIHRTDIDTDESQHGFSQKVECNSKLAVALSVIEECFLPINDRRSGINLIHNVIYNRGSNYSRLNHSGFYTAILERDDEIIAAASIRIHGTQLAEMPFIGTRYAYRRQGMCRRLLCAIESALSSLKVEKFVIPAVAENMHTWTGSFGFNPLGEIHKKEMRSLNMLVFPRTDMLQKKLVERNTIKEHLTAESGAKLIVSKEYHYLEPVVNKSFDFDSSLRHDSSVCDNASLKNPLQKDNGAAVINSSSRATVSYADASSNSSLDLPSESNLKVLSKDENEGFG